MDVTPGSRVVDWTLFALTVGLAVTGIWTGLAGTPSEWWVFAAHGTLAVLFVIFLIWKLARVATRLRLQNWDRGTKTSVLLVTLAFAALGTGIAWTWGAPIWINNLAFITVHAVLGLLVLPVIALHLRHRYHGLDSTDYAGRRTAVTYLLLGILATILWRVQRIIAAGVGTVVRFTGSRERGSFEGNAFPRTEWAADDPEPVDGDAWELTVSGVVETPGTFQLSDLDPETTADGVTLDCTSGWYTVQDWQGISLATLLDAVSPTDTARYVTIESVTGYRWTYSLDEADDLLLATHVDEQRLSHAHGYPLRLVAPGHRGYRWVKWVQRIDVRRHPDPGKWIAIFTSGFD